MSIFVSQSVVHYTHRAVVRTGRDRIAARMELDAVHVRQIALERLHHIAGAHVPNECHFVATLLVR